MTDGRTNKAMMSKAGGDIVVRSMTGNDIDQIMQIWLTANIQAHDFISETYWKGQFENVKNGILLSEVYVCEKADRIAGFAGFCENYIAGIFVAPDFQSNGVGKILLDYVRTFKKELYLHVYQKNARAVKFYQRENFVIESETVDNTGEKEFLMRAL